MIRSFRNKGLNELFNIGRSAKVPANLRVRCDEILHILDAASSLNDLSVPGLRCHPVDPKKTRHGLDVNGPWRITFEFRAPDAWLVDLEQYH